MCCNGPYIFVLSFISKQTNTRFNQFIKPNALARKGKDEKWIVMYCINTGNLCHKHNQQHWNDPPTCGPNSLRDKALESRITAHVWIYHSPSLVGGFGIRTCSVSRPLSIQQSDQATGFLAPLSLPRKHSHSRRTNKWILTPVRVPRIHTRTETVNCYLFSYPKFYANKWLI